MRFLLVLGLATLWAGAVQAQTAPAPAPQTPEAQRTYDPAVDARERERIAVERDAVQRKTGEVEMDCYQRFAVSTCLRDVRKERRVALEALRKQELALNDVRRAATTAAQVRKVQDRQAQKEAGAPGSDGRPASGTAKSASPAATKNAASASASEEAQRRERLQREYAEKQRLARERQESRDQKQQSSTSRPLPVPP